ncbi:hypothetical protein FA15DRAFT_646586 [Coprinopsis marcescibilis]|uniref:Uncharacterized protein n=1 Tax=Coprinopsis marcescibilis TaxID=230819 RepID=A0A5C3KLC4_COPMA|nr:hypothetical protein FA15DRAFT_646586 [Coprinopsis marcescibilis]
MDAQTTQQDAPPPSVDEINDNVITDPPPPYPDPARRRSHGGRVSSGNRSRRSGHNLHTIQTDSSMDSYGELDGILATPSQGLISSGPSTDDNDLDAERATFLSPPSPSQLQRSHRHPGMGGRPPSISHASTLSAAPSLAHTVLSLFQLEQDHDDEGGVYLPDEGFSEQHLHHMLEEERDDGLSLHSTRRNESKLARYFRPMGRPLYYRALIHLLFINFPYALAAWIYLFVFTLTGTTLLVALPLGALFCFLDLLGARLFSRGELALQTRFHSPLSYPTPYPPRPIFTRYRELTSQEIETGRMASSRPGGLVKEKSFYKNAYAMFTDPTSYQALFYFIVIKPAITLGLLLFILIFVVPAIILVIPAPAALRAVRRLGKWQANIAVEGLYFAVR